MLIITFRLWLLDIDAGQAEVSRGRRGKNWKATHYIGAYYIHTYLREASIGVDCRFTRGSEEAPRQFEASRAEFYCSGRDVRTIEAFNMMARCITGIYCVVEYFNAALPAALNRAISSWKHGLTTSFYSNVCTVTQLDVDQT